LAAFYVASLYSSVLSDHIIADIGLISVSVPERHEEIVKFQGIQLGRTPKVKVPKRDDVIRAIKTLGWQLCPAAPTIVVAELIDTPALDSSGNKALCSKDRKAPLKSSPG
jgi:hypothetical protein